MKRFEAGMKSSFVMNYGSLGGKEKWDIEIVRVNLKSIRYKLKGANGIWNENTKSIEKFEERYGKYFQ